MLFFDSTICPHNTAYNPYNKCHDTNDLFYCKYTKKTKKHLTYRCQYCGCTVYHSHNTEWKAKRKG